MWRLALVALGGGLGTALRYGAAVAMARWLGVGFPWGTLAVNVIGSFALAIVMEALPERPIGGVEARWVLGTGLLGGFTTYSSFNLETLRLVEQGAWGRASGYVLATLVGCMAAGLAGLAIARWLKSQ